MLLDAKGFPYASLDSYESEICVPPPFTGATSNTRGDKDGTLTSFPLFYVTGEVRVIVYGVCTTTLVGAGTLEVGLTGNTALVLPQVADATTIAANDVWVDSSVGEVRGFVSTSLPSAIHITNGNDILETSGTTDITAGNIYYVCFWRPMRKGSKVVAVFP